MRQLCNVAYSLMIDGQSADEVKHLNRILDGGMGRETPSKGTEALMAVMGQFKGSHGKTGGRYGR